MHSPETIQQFIQLRAERKSLRRIAETLGVALNTARKWDHQYAQQVDDLSVIHLETLQERYLAAHEDKLADLATELQQLTAELKDRDFQDVSTEFLLYRKTCVQSRLEKLAFAPAPLRRVPAPQETPEQPNEN